MEESPASQSPVAPLSEDFQMMDESPASQSPMAPLSGADIYAEDAGTTGSADAASHTLLSKETMRKHTESLGHKVHVEML